MTIVKKNNCDVNKIKTCYEQGTMTIVKNYCAVQENKDLLRARDYDYR